MEHMGMKSDHHNPVAGNHNIQPLYSSAPKYTSTMEHMGMKSDHHNPVAGNHNIQPLYSSAPKYTSTMEHMGNHLLLVNIVPNSDVYMVSHMLHTMENHV